MARAVLLQWLAAGPSGAGRRDAMSGTRKAKQGHYQDNVHETNVFELHCENQHFFVCVSVDEIVFEKAPWGVGNHPPSNSQSGINPSSELLKNIRNYFGLTQFAMRMGIRAYTRACGRQMLTHAEYARAVSFTNPINCA